MYVCDTLIILLPRHGPLPPAPGSDVAIVTSSNTAYEMMKQEEGQGGIKEGEYQDTSPGGPPVGEEGAYEITYSEGGTEDVVYEHIQ